MIQELLSSFGSREEQIPQEETKTQSVQRILDAATGKMRDNITRLFDNEADLEQMGSRSEGLKMTAE